MNVNDTERAALSRRSLLLGAGAGAIAAGVGALGTGPSAALGAGAAQAAVSPFVKGADISWAAQMEARGYTWKNSAGVQQDLFTILQGYGISAVRLRTFVNPSPDPVHGHCSISEVAAYARRCQDAGFNILLDFMFGDSWNSVGGQTAPRAWQSLSYSDMRTTLGRYVADCMKTLKNNGVNLTWCQLGNEENKGICGDTGSVSRPAQMTGLIMAGYNALKDAYPDCSALIHLAQPQKEASVRTFLTRYRDNGGLWDITALSSYAQGKSVSGVLTSIKSIQADFGKPVMQVEMGGPVSKPAATKASIKEIMTGIRDMGGLGSFYWEPEGYSPFCSYDMVAWDSSTRKPTIIMDAFTEV